MLPSTYFAFPWRSRQIGRQPRKSSIRLEVQELESRCLLSASAQFAVPNMAAAPLAGSGSHIYYTPQQIRHAYGFDKITLPGGQTADGTGQTIAIVDAYDAPNIATALQTFDAQFGLPDTTLIKTSPTGTTPAADYNWGGEISLDVQWAHAIAPKATILLVEAASPSYTDLLAAVDYARNYEGVSVVSMSWGGGEFSGQTALDSHFTTPVGHTGITFIASTGDSGAWYGPEWPATSPNVLAVGGTSLTAGSTGTYSSETGWSGSGGGYSAVEAEPAYQKSVQSTGVRLTPDISYDANPNTGVLAYYTPSTGSGGWYVVGGTSIGAPQWGGLVAVANQGRAATGQPSLNGVQAAIYGLPASDFHDITTGSNGYRAGKGYDLVTGRGSPYADRVVAGLITAANPSTPASAASSVKTATTTTGTSTSTVTITTTGSGNTGKNGRVATASVVTDDGSTIALIGISADNTFLTPPQDPNLLRLRDDAQLVRTIILPASPGFVSLSSRQPFFVLTPPAPDAFAPGGLLDGDNATLLNTVEDTDDA